MHSYMYRPVCAFVIHLILSLPTCVSPLMANQHPASLLDLGSKPHKKPRHRHSPAQLVALNQLFVHDEHPSLEARSILAERLGM